MDPEAFKEVRTQTIHYGFDLGRGEDKTVYVSRSRSGAIWTTDDPDTLPRQDYDIDLTADKSE